MTLRSFIKSGLITLLCLSVLGYLSFQLFRPKGDAIQTEIAVYDTKREVAEITGFIFRDETVILNPFKGFVSYTAMDSQKLGLLDRIADVYTTSTNTGVRNQISEINHRIDVLNRSTIDIEYISTSTDRLDSEVEKMYADLLDGAARSNAKNILIERDEILIRLNRRQMLTRTVDSFQDQITALTAQRDALLGTINRPGTLAEAGNEIYAPQAGTFYTGVDGYESHFTPEMISTISIDDFNTLLTTQPDAAITENAIGKIAPDYDWHLVCLIDKTDAPYFEPDRQYTLVFPYSGDAKIKCILERKVVQTNNDKVLLAFKTLMAPDYFNFTRKQTVKIVLYEVTGLKVPHSALRVVDDDIGVFVLSGNQVKFRLIKEEDKLWENHNYYLISEGTYGENDDDSYGRLKLYDQIIVAGKDLHDGMIVE